MPKKKGRRLTECATATRFVNKIANLLKTLKKEVTIEDFEKVIEKFRKYPEIFEKSKKRMYTFVRSVLEVYFISKSKFSPGKIPKSVDKEFFDWRIQDFFQSSYCKNRFEGLRKSFQAPLTQNQTMLLDAFQNIFKMFELKKGGRNRKILLHLLRKEGVESEFLGQFAGVTGGWVRQAKDKVTTKELEKFFARFELDVQKNMFSKRELDVVLKSFQLHCPGNSYTKTDKYFRQICSDDELYKKYQTYINDHNRQQLLKNESYDVIPIRCYNVFLTWKKNLKVKKTLQRDIDYNCVYCFEHWTVGRDISQLTMKIETKKSLILLLQSGKFGYFFHIMTIRR